MGGRRQASASVDRRRQPSSGLPDCRNPTHRRMFAPFGHSKAMTFIGGPGRMSDTGHVFDPGIEISRICQYRGIAPDSPAKIFHRRMSRPCPLSRRGSLDVCG